MSDNIRILWLFSDLLDLYGDCGNLMMLERRIRETGRSCETIKPAAEETPDFDACDMIYIGPGKARNVAYAAGCLAKYSDAFRAAIDAGKTALVTGSGRLLLGRSFENADGGITPGLGIFEHTAKETGNVFVSDLVGRAQVEGEPRCYGFINRTAHLVGDCGEPLFLLEHGAGDGEPPSKTEGSRYKNLFASWCLGPLLVKNPALCRAVLKTFLGELPEFDDALEQRALDLTLSEFD